jgi:hypothetical protein
MTRGRVGGRKREDTFVKDDVTRDIDPTCGAVKTLETKMMRAVTEENTLTRPELKFMVIVWPKIWPTRAPEDTENLVFDRSVEEFCDRCGVVKNTAGHAID